MCCLVELRLRQSLLGHEQLHEDHMHHDIGVACKSHLCIHIDNVAINVAVKDLTPHVPCRVRGHDEFELPFELHHSLCCATCAHLHVNA